MVFSMKYIILLPIILFIFTQYGLSKTINVPDDFNSIKLAINEASPNDIVFVKAGTYKENIEIRKKIKLRGTGSDKTILLGLITISKAEDVEISGFRIEGLGRDAHFGIWCEASSVLIKNNVILSYHHCIGSDSSSIIIDNNEISKSLNAGILIWSSINSQIRNNLIKDNVDVGILIASSGDKTIIDNNIISDNRIGIGCSASRPKIRRNMIINNQIGVQTDNQDVPDIGTEKDQGLNVIMDNKIHIMNLNRKQIIVAEGNYWGTPDGPKETDFDGKIDYEPWLVYNPLLSNQLINPKYGVLSTWGKVKIKYD